MFLAKIRKFKMADHMWEEENFWKIVKTTLLRYPVGRNFAEITLSHTVKETDAYLCFAISGKNLKIQNGRHFWGEENFLKIGNSPFLRYLVNRKFQRNRSISHG